MATSILRNIASNMLSSHGKCMNSLQLVAKMSSLTSMTRCPTGTDSSTSTRDFLSVPNCINTTQVRNTVVVRRRDQIQLPKEGGKPWLKKRHRFIELVDVEHTKKVPDMEVLLTTYVEGFGNQGDVVTVRAGVARNHLLPLSLATYVTPESLAQYKQKDSDEAGMKQTAYMMKTVRQLEGMQFVIPMNGYNPWTLTKTHVRVALRKAGVEAPDSCIIMPEAEVNSAGGDEQRVPIRLTVNTQETAEVMGVVYLELRAEDRPERPAVHRFKQYSQKQKLRRERSAAHRIALK